MELDTSATQDDAARRAWRRNGALIIGASLIVGVAAAASIVAWRNDDDEPVAQRTVAPSITTTGNPTAGNQTPPASSISMARTELARVTLPSGEVVRFEESQDNYGSWCLVRGLGQESISCFGLGPTRPTVTQPQFTGPPAGPGFFTFLLPAGFAPDVTVRDSAGVSVPSARSSDGMVLLVLDREGPINGPPSARPARPFDLVTGDGRLLARVTIPAFSGTSGGPTGDPRLATVACLRAQGLAVPDPASGPQTAVSTPRYPPETALPAWQKCRDTFVAAIPSSVSAADSMARFDCLAAQGWLTAVSSGPPSDLAAYNAASAACATQTPSRIALVACLQSRGLQISEPPAQPFPAAAAAVAWQNCRDAWMTASGAPPQIVTRYDCMASRGWIMALITGPPVDAAGYNAASVNCGS